MKKLNALTTRYFHLFFQGNVAPLSPAVSPTVVCYNMINFFTLKKSLQSEYFCALEGFFKNRPQRVQIGHAKGPNGLKKHQNGFYICWSSFLAYH